jgi:UDP-2,3-diacylglucosamine pyrophosphatase LpxH
MGRRSNMSASERLTEVFESAKEIPFDDSSKFVLFSDIHRGDNSWADDFAHNQNLFFHALKDYHKRGFTYIEIGDGDELWENSKFDDIRRAHSHVFWLMKQFYQDNRLYLVHGNHDMERRDPKKVEETLAQYYDQRDETKKELFKGIQVHEGLVLRHTATDNKIFVFHGHQGDLMNDTLWWLSRFFVRNFWKHLQLLGIKDPTSPAKNFTKRAVVEDRIKEWIEANHQMVICGHTHRSVLPKVGETPYFNTGSCVHPRCITGMEIESGEISLIKWWFAPNDEGVMRITRELLAGPEKLQSFFKVN